MVTGARHPNGNLFTLVTSKAWHGQDVSDSFESDGRWRQIQSAARDQTNRFLAQSPVYSVFVKPTRLIVRSVLHPDRGHFHTRSREHKSRLSPQVVDTRGCTCQAVDLAMQRADVPIQMSGGLNISSQTCSAQWSVIERVRQCCQGGLQGLQGTGYLEWSQKGCILHRSVLQGSLYRCTSTSEDARRRRRDELDKETSR